VPGWAELGRVGPGRAGSGRGSGVLARGGRSGALARAGAPQDLERAMPAIRRAPLAHVPGGMRRGRLCGGGICAARRQATMMCDTMSVGPGPGPQRIRGRKCEGKSAAALTRICVARAVRRWRQAMYDRLVEEARAAPLDLEVLGEPG
jgi:hypothetical protein